MQAARGVLVIAVAVMLTLAGCSKGDKVPSLMNIRSTTQGPDEFAVLPPKPLSLPEDLTALPEPTPGGANLTDPTPEADAIAALGGNLRAAGGIPAGDGGLVNYAARFGVAGDIRDTLATEDLAWRQKNDGRLLERLLKVNVYFKAYEAMWLDQQAELWRWRRAGVKTPSAPPPQPGEE
ncbi:DUF3035 domain-containing protein [Paragemmobacter straminiformis]|uniref:DUF3035 domain-containing protein n=1 Tax=Paragemmobacter straminiformis TaxID=2045119 RepID=A0A842I964_9RHOB|nr:DUF3035 domain-containing protein [Gemmobacter straminiformis]MBC2836175.1 DUF3035 domain-containing protein [Gemmobacter straminiformis]